MTISSYSDFVAFCQKRSALHASNSCAWPTESGDKLKDRSKCRKARGVDHFIEELAVLNILLEKVKEQLTVPEMIGAHLYTGPLFQKYNAVLRSFTNNEKMIEIRKKLCKGNSYATTLHVVDLVMCDVNP